ncbi:MAG: TonB-dependent receptor [Caulobacter sp.]|nr:TonB-dependent receptor [Caulobacter sp.]
MTTIVLAGASGAQAQTSGGADNVEVEAVVVTGTAIRGVAPVGSATVEVNRETIVEAPQRDASALISQLPQASGLGSTLANNAGRNAGVNLRGLGNNATLLLFDGHRTVAQGVTNQIADPNVIPFAAIERVEVVTDGASAIYGSDAVAGVVNFILRRPFNGAEITARYKDSLYHQYTVEGVFGRKWDSGGIMVGLTWEKNDHVRRSDSKYLSQDLRPFGGNDNRFIGTTVTPDASGALIVGTTVYGLPANLNGRVPTAAEVLALKNNPSLIDTARYTDYYTQRERVGGVVRLNQNFGRAGDLTATLLFNNRKNNAPGTGDGAFTNVGVTVTPSSPYYIAGLGSGNQTVVYNFRANNPDRELDQNNKENTFNLLVDYSIDLAGDFKFTGTGVYGNNFGCATCQPQGNTVLAAVITGASYNGAFNPYRQGAQPTAEGLFGGFVQKAQNELLNFSGKVDGSLFELPSGKVRIAAGLEYQKLDFQLRALNTLNLATAYQTSRYAKSHRVIESGYAELFVPIFGGDNARPGLQRLDLSAAVRYDHYSDVGKTTNPKIGLSWDPTEDIHLRASWGTSFRAATLGESDPRTIGQTNRTFVSNGLNDPSIPVTNVATGQSLVLLRTGNTSGLRPESAKIYSFGGDWTPSFAPDLKLGVTYYNVDYKDRIENLPNTTLILSNPTTYALYKDFFIVAPQPASCVNGNPPGLMGTPQYSTYNPAYLPWLNDPNAVYSPSTANDCQMVGIITGGLRNLGRVTQSGLDFTGAYGLDTPAGRLTLNGSFSYILDLKRSLLPNSPLVKALDTYGNQISKRGRIGANLRNGDWSANIAANYIGSYLNNATITVNGVKNPDTMVPSWTTFDAGFAYNVPGSAPTALQGMRFAINIQNLTDKDPPIVLTQVGTAANAIDLNVHNVFGRVWSVEVTKKF